MAIYTQRQYSLIAAGGSSAGSSCVMNSETRMERIEYRYAAAPESGSIPEEFMAMPNVPDSLNHIQKGDPRSA